MGPAQTRGLKWGRAARSVCAGAAGPPGKTRATVRALAVGVLSLGLATGFALTVDAPASAAASTPALTQLIGHYVAQRAGTVSVAVYDVNANQLSNYNGVMRNDTASIVKVDILEALLYQTRGQLSSSDRRLATTMIEQLDNNAATRLWNEDGGASGIGVYNHLAGLHCPSLDRFGYWGLTLTCAHDQVRLLSHLAVANRLLSDASRQYELFLMEHVVSWQRWGVSSGIPSSGVSVALKNGWLPHGNAPWIVNSIGIVRGDGRSYYIAVLTRDPSEQYGIDTIDAISRIVWGHVSRQP